ncbi:DNA gyrase subunit B [Plasmodium gonderi]|uniref:DNA topoisomerase 2 n=1 Tax=Plasmodium gonderi TaxID=77519 RepID=A0A1Y1JND4_PLAGO|nr:DNA gyrase subunit B [Plasmodium gonderi]GAW83770.1 DNA gyrase subunit B [Plasmodium gonderi]
MNMRFSKSFPIFILLLEYFLIYTRGKVHDSNTSTSNRLNKWNFRKRDLKRRFPFTSYPNDEIKTFKRKRTPDRKKLSKKKAYCFFTSIKGVEKIKREEKNHKNFYRSFRCKDYDAKDIVILEGLEAVRKRPGMYIGNTDVKGLHQILFEIIDNSVDEYNNFECNEIKIVIHRDESVTIEDNGRGIPCDIHEKTKKSALETVLTVLHSGAKFHDDEISEELSGKKDIVPVDAVASVGAEEKSNGRRGIRKAGRREDEEKEKVDQKQDGKENLKAGSKATEMSEEKSAQKEHSPMYKFSSGLHGVGLSVANALSSFMNVKVFRDGKIYSIGLEKGKVVHPLTVHNYQVYKRGTQIHYKPDNTIFKNTIKHNAEFIKNRIHQLAYLNDRLVFYFCDERVANRTSYINLSKGSNKSDRDDKKEKIMAENSISSEEKDPKFNKQYTDERIVDGVKKLGEDQISHYKDLYLYNYEVIKHEGGLNEYIDDLTKNKMNLFKDSNKTISICCHNKNVYIDLRMKWMQNQYHENIISFVNNVYTSDGGTHVDALKHAISRCVNFNIKKNETTKNYLNVPGEYIREGLTAILSVRMNNPEFEGQTKTKLGSHHLKPILESIVFEKLSEIFDFEPNLLNTLYLKALQAKASDEEAKAARDLIRSKNNQYYSTILPGKLVDCISNDTSRNEIFIVEGDSAAGSAKQARNREIQAILPLKGKILNVEKIKNNKRIFENSELKSLITAIGLSVNCDNTKITKGNNILNKKKKDIKKKYDLKNMKNDNTQVNNSMMNKKKNSIFDTPIRYGKIIIMTDADVDGEHIRILLLTFLYKFQKDIIENGNVYVACPPLYKITYNRFFDNSIKEIVTKQFNVTTKNSKFLIHTYSDDELNELLRLLDQDRAYHTEQKNIESQKAPSTDEVKSKINDNENYLSILENAELDQQNKDNEISEINQKILQTGNETQSSSLISNNTLFTFSKKYEIQRFKGLGEMMADQLWNTTMDPSVRKLIRVTVNDAIRANNLIYSLMGEDSKLRKNFILENSPSSHD